MLFRSGAGTGGNGQVAVQSVFSMLDVLTAWVSKAKMKAQKGIAAKDKDKGRDKERERDGSKIIPSPSRSSHPFNNDPCLCISALLAAVPKETLGQAALRIKAYARALRYFEMHARETSLKEKCGIKGAGSVRHIDGTDSTSAAILHAHRPLTGLAGTYSSRNDGSNGVLPNLTEAQLDRLMNVFSDLEDPDALQGVQVLR